MPQTEHPERYDTHMEEAAIRTTPKNKKNDKRTNAEGSRDKQATPAKRKRQKKRIGYARCASRDPQAPERPLAPLRRRVGRQ